MCENENILEVRHLKQYFGKKDFKAVDDISFTVKKGEVVGIVGESDCGKTTTGRSIIKLYNATSGDVYFKGSVLSQAPVPTQMLLQRNAKLPEKELQH